MDRLGYKPRQTARSSALRRDIETLFVVKSACPRRRPDRTVLPGYSAGAQPGESVVDYGLARAVREPGRATVASNRVSCLAR